MFKMSREELKRVMLEMGVDPKFVEMPSIMERAFDLLSTCRTLNEIKSKITVTDSHTEVVGNVRMLFYEVGTKTVIEIRHDPRKKSGLYDIIYLDEYGMDQYYEPYKDDYSDLFTPSSDPYYTIRRDLREKVIYIEDYYRGKPSHPEFYEDGKAYFCLRNIEQDNGDYDISCNDRTWEENKEFLCAYYQSVRKWFEQREPKKTTDEYREEYEKLLSLNSELKADIDQSKQVITQENIRRSKLLYKANRLQKMLTSALSFCQSVRHIPFGGLLFNTKKSKLPSKSEIEHDVEDR